jgi:PhnB protein
MTGAAKTSIAPMLFIPNGIRDISFYNNAFGAIEVRRWSNDDGSLHVAELTIGEVLLHLHEITDKPYFFAPEKYNGCTAVIGLFVDDVNEVMQKALSAGATEIAPAQDYDYGYRQGEVKDPFGHHWVIQMKI